jgi:hypothetical protein
MRGTLVGLAGTVALLMAPAAGRAADPFEAQVRNLAHPRYAEREKAARDLEKAGEPALKALKTAMASGDEEVRARAAAVVAKIERTIRSQRLLVAPKVALKFDKTPLNHAVEEVARKTGLRFVLDGPRVTDVKRPVTLDTGEVPLWESVQAFCAAAGLAEVEEPAPAPSADREIAFRAQRQLVIKSYVRGAEPLGASMIRLGDGKPELPAAVGNALRVRTLPAAYGQNKYDDVKGEVTFHLDVDAVPGLNLQEIIGIDVRRATAEDARVLASAYPAPEGLSGFYDQVFVGQQVVIINGELMAGGASGIGPHYPVTLKTGGLRPKRLAELEGVVVARVVTPPEPILTATDLLGKGVGKTFQGDGLSCQVRAVEGPAEQAPIPRAIRPAGEQPTKASDPAALASVQVRLTTTAEAANEILNIPVAIKGRVRPFVRINRRGGEQSVNLPEFQVRDADGKSLRVTSTRLMNMSFDGTGVTQDVQLTFEKPAKGSEVVSLTLAGRRVAIVELPFVLKNVPLP